MTTIYLVLKISTLLLAIVLPLRGSKKNKNGTIMEISDWVVNENGCLENLAEKQSKHHPIK
jgi:hypothetical protein